MVARVPKPSSTSSPVGSAPRFRLRPDVQAYPRWRGLQRHWVLKQAMTLEHFEVTDDEWALLRCFDGTSTPAEARQRYNAAYRPRNLSDAGLHRFLRQACEVGVLAAIGAGRAEAINEQEQRGRQKRTLAGLLSIIAPRLSLFDPSLILRWLSPFSRLIFNTKFAVVLIAIATVVLGVAVGRSRDIAISLSAFDEVFTPSRVVSLLVVWVVVKVVHEFGHAMACQRFGGECHDVGVFFIAGAPMLYCDVSDAWTFASPWRRAVVSAGGVYVELLIAVLCGSLWLLAEPGMVRSIMGQVVVICGVSTLLFNANPLLKLDGYYLLSDLTNCANLQERSRRALTQPVLRWLTLGKLVNNQEPANAAMRLYGVASGLYRLFVMAVICWVVWAALKPLGLGVIGAAFAGIALGSLLIPPIQFATQVARNPVTRRAFVPLRLLLIMATLVAIVAGMLLLPAPDTLRCPAMVVYAKAQSVVAPADGKFVPQVDAGQRVTSGTVLGRLDAPDLVIRVEAAKARLAETQLEKALVKAELAYSDDSAARLESLNAFETAARERLAALESELSALSLRADRDGIVVPPPQRDAQSPIDGALLRWEGTPVDPPNRGCWLVAGEPVCEIGEPADARAMILVGQSSIDLIRAGVAVRLRLDNAPCETLHGRVLSIGRRPATAVPPTFVASQDILMERASDGTLQPTEQHFFVEASIEGTSARLFGRSPGYARIGTRPRSLLEWAWRELNRVFAAVR